MFKRFSRPLVLCNLAILVACGGSSGSGDDDESADCTGGYVNVDSIGPQQGSLVTITGTAFASESYYCNRSARCFPGVDVTYENLTSGDAGQAASHFSGWTGRHSWTADVLLVPGKNTIKVRAEARDGTYCTETVRTRAARSRVLQIYPANLVRKVHDRSVIAARIDGEVDASKIDENSMVVSDQYGVAVRGRLELEFDDYEQFSTLTFFPDYPLAPATRYRVTLETEIISIEEAPDSDDFSWVFTTWNY